jgi:putative DNA primase/helicase
MRCAKTLLLDILAQVAANTTGRTSNLTESVVFHLSHKGKTFIVDELENMRNQDREKYGAVMAVLNAGFQSGAKVYRMKKTENGFEEQEFDAYSPKAIAGINKLSDTLEDRSFHIAMTRKTRAETVKRFSIRRQGKELEALRAELKLWATEREKNVADLYDAIDQILEGAQGEELRALDDRFLDICEPLLSISLYADIEHSNGGEQVTARLRDLLLAMAGAKSQEAENGELATILGVLKAVLGKELKAFISSAELLEKIQPELSWITSKKRLAGFLGRFDLVSGKDPTGVIRGYAITKEWVDDIEFRYLPGFETSEPSGTRAQSGSESIL